MIRRSPRSRSSVYKRGNGRMVGDYEDATSKKRHVSGKTKPDVLHKLCKLLEDRRPGSSTTHRREVDGLLDRLHSGRGEAGNVQAVRDNDPSAHCAHARQCAARRVNAL